MARKILTKTTKPVSDSEEKKEQGVKDRYVPSKPDQKELDFTYGRIASMIDERNQGRRQFNDRTLVPFLDDSEKRVQGYVPTRESQKKEDWQSNVFNQSTRNKLKAIVAAVANTPPKMKYKAVSLQDGGLDLRRAEVMENLVAFSRSNINPEVEIFWEAWSCATQGTVIKYDGYLHTKAKRKFIKSYDLETGEISFDEKDVVVDDECIDQQVPLTELFIADFTIENIQNQPDMAWIRYMDKAACDLEFSRFAKYKYVRDKKNSKPYREDTKSFFFNSWRNRVAEDDEYEVIKYYNKYRDTYNIIINGVLILSAPMLWGRRRKVYPFAKTIFEPFSNRHFFYGNSLPNANMDVQDVINTLYNMSLDKTYRSLNPPLLAGIRNKDLLEQENDRMGMESTIYVEDVNQVVYQKIPGITDSEMTMIKWVAQGMDMGTVDVNQQGIAGRGVTAREIVISNENAKRLKGIFFMFLNDLWIQKTRLRMLNILQNYTLPKVEEVIGPNGSKTYKETFRKIIVENSTFPDGKSGTLEIQMVGKRNDLPTKDQLDIKEQKMRLQGKPYQAMAMVSTYVDNFDYDVQVVSETIYQKDSVEAQAELEQKLKMLAAFFPQIFLANYQELFGDWAKAYGEDEKKYKVVQPQAQNQGGAEGQEGGQATPEQAKAAAMAAKQGKPAAKAI